MKQYKLWVIRHLYVQCSMFALVFGFAFTQAGAEELTKVRMAQNLSPISGVVIVAKQKGLFEKHGLDVVVSNFTSGKQALDAVIGGGADIATTAEAPVTAAAMAKQKIAFITRMEYSDLQTLTAASAKINSLADLKGKRIGYTVGTGSEVYTMLLLKRAGLTKRDVTLVSLRPQDMAAALSSGGIDAMDTWEPHISNAEKAFGASVKELDTKGIYAETFNIVTMQDYLAAKPDVVLNFLRSMLDAEKWMKANREEAISIVAKAVGMNRDDLAPIWNKFIYEVALDKRTIDVLRNHAEWRLKSGNAPAGATMPDFSKVIFSAPLEQVAPDRVKLNFKED